jgi:hypothetical protein
MNDIWETDNDSDDASLQDQLDGLTRSFLERPPDRGEPKRPTQPSTQNTTPEIQTKRTESDSILQSIQYLKNTYGPVSGEGVRPILYAKAVKLF